MVRKKIDGLGYFKSSLPVFLSNAFASPSNLGLIFVVLKSDIFVDSITIFQLFLQVFSLLWLHGCF